MLRRDHLLLTEDAVNAPVSVGHHPVDPLLNPAGKKQKRHTYRHLGIIIFSQRTVNP